MRIKKHFQLRAISVVTSLLMILSLFTPIFTLAKGNMDNANSSKSIVHEKLSNILLDEFKTNKEVTFLVKFKEKVDIDRIVEEVKKNAKKTNLSSFDAKYLQRSTVVTELKTTAERTQQSVLSYVKDEEEKGNANSIRSYFIVNGMAITATKEVAEKIAEFPEVEKVLPNEKIELNSTKSESTEESTDEIEWNIDRVGAPEAWDKGINGEGVVVASIDTGAEWDHPALKEKYRGYDASTDEVNHDYSWYDAITVN